MLVQVAGDFLAANPVEPTDEGIDAVTDTAERG